MHEAEIDQIVYRLFDLTPDEIALIESALAPTRATKPSKRQGGRAAATPKSSVPAHQDSIPAEVVVSSEPPTTTSEISPAVSAWMPGELLTLEGELTPAKKARAAPKAALASAAPIAKSKPVKGAIKATSKAVSQTAASTQAKPNPISDVPRDDVMAAIRELFADSQPRSTETVVRELCQKFGHRRVSAAAREVLLKDLFTASRRQILYKCNDQYRLFYSQIGDYDQDSLKKQFLAAIAKEGRVWHSREGAIRLFARHLGFRRTGSVIEKTARSLITKLLKEGKLEKDGTVWIRRC